jgi:hypothetical protein
VVENGGQAEQAVKAVLGDEFLEIAAGIPDPFSSQVSGGVGFKIIICAAKTNRQIADAPDGASWPKNNFRLDSICPTGVGKVAGVKVENDEEKVAGGAEGDPPWPRLSPSQCYGGTSRRDKLARFGLWCAGINGVGREKAPAFAKKLRRDKMARQAIGREIRGISTWQRGRRRKSGDTSLRRTGGITGLFEHFRDVASGKSMGGRQRSRYGLGLFDGGLEKELASRWGESRITIKGHVGRGQ